MNIIFCLNSPKLVKNSQEEPAVYIHFYWLLRICLMEEWILYKLLTCIV